MSKLSSITTLHGELKLPVFMPDATYGAVKTLTTQDLKQTGTRALVTTTLHIEQQLGSAYVQEIGGLHQLLSWDRPIVTDSGGFQVFSLIHAKKHKDNRISEAGCSFVDYRTGSYNFLSPEISQQIQHNLGSDIRVVLDEPTPVNTTSQQEKEAVTRTTRWAKRSKQKFLQLLGITEKDFDDPSIKRPLLCCVVQGGNNFELRKQSALELQEIGFDIYGFGGAPMLKQITWKDDPRSGKFYRELLDYTAELLPTDKVRYALGVGTPDDIEYCIERGWQMFDTVLPSRNARHGSLYVPIDQGDKNFANYSLMHIKTERYKNNLSSINEDSLFPELRENNRAYLRHLIRINEAAGMRLATLNNLEFYQRSINKYINNSTDV